jgi:hypothetical protein
VDKVSRVAEDGKAKHCKKFQRLHKTQHPALPPDNKKTVINLSEVPLEEADGSALSKGLNYAVAPAVLPVEDILCGVEKAVGALPEETAEEVRQDFDFTEPISSILKMEAISSSETSVETQRTTRRHIPEDDTLQNRRENLKSSYHFSPLWSKYSLQHPVLRHLQPMFFP